MSMHLTKIQSSKRLQSIIGLLMERGRYGATTKELHEISGSMATSTEISCIRAQGYDIKATYEGRSEAGSKIYRYVLNTLAPVEGLLF